MRVKLFLSSLFILLANIVVAQSLWRVPQSFNYQMVVRDANDWIVRSQQIGMLISIQNGTTPATTLYSETHSVATDINGYLSINVGAGTPVHGRFDTISWGKYDSVLLYVQVDITGGTNYTLTATQQLAAVPFAFMADETQDFPDVLKNGNRAGMRQLKELKDPTDPQDVITKYYLDSVIADFLAMQSVAMQHDTLCLSAIKLPVEWRSRQLGATGIYYDTLVGRAEGGKDSVYALHLTVSDGTHNVFVHADNSPYVWDRDGQTYTVTGEYVYEYVDDSRCPSADTLKLTISQPSCVANRYNVQQKTPYLWPASGEKGHGDGNTHDVSGTYYGAVYDGNCVDTLDLVISVDVHTAIDTFVCEGTYYDTLLYEGFETGIPASWSTTTGSGSSGWKATSAVTIEGTYYSPFAGQRFVHEDGGESRKYSYLKTPQINIADPENTYVQFHYMNSYWKNTSYSNIITLRYSTSKSGTYSEVWSSGTTNVQSTWYPANVSLQSLAAGQYYFAFVDYDGGGDCGAVDEVMILHRRVPAEVEATVAGGTVVTQKTLTAHDGGDSIVDITWHIMSNVVSNIDTAVLQPDFPTTWRGFSFAKPGVKEKKLVSVNGCDSIVTMKVNVLVDVEENICEGVTEVQYYDTLFYDNFENDADFSNWTFVNDPNSNGYYTSFGWDRYSSYKLYYISSTTNYNLHTAYGNSGYSMMSASKLVLNYSKAYSNAYSPSFYVDDPANTSFSFVYAIPWQLYGSYYYNNGLMAGTVAGPSFNTRNMMFSTTDHTGYPTYSFIPQNFSLSSLTPGTYKVYFRDYDSYSMSIVDEVCVRTKRTLHYPSDLTAGVVVLYDTVHSINGYDSIRRRTVHVGSSASSSVEKTVDVSEFPITWNGVTFNAAGSKKVFIKTVQACDSVVTMSVNVKVDKEYNVCEGGVNKGKIYLLNEDFNDGSAEGWEVFSDYDKNAWTLYDVVYDMPFTDDYYDWETDYRDVYAYGGTGYSAISMSYGYENISVLQSPAVTITDPANTYISFVYVSPKYRYCGYYGCDSYYNEIGFSYFNTSSSDFVSPLLDVRDVSDWTEVTYSLASLAPGTYYFKFLSYDGGGAFSAVDDVRIYMDYPSSYPASVASASVGQVVVVKDTIKVADGCDSIINKTFRIFPKYHVGEERTVGALDLPYVWNNVSFESAGVKSTVLHSIYMCDSVVDMTLKVNSLSANPISSNLNQTVKKGQPIKDIAIHDVQVAGLPDGVVYDSTSGKITGIPTVAGVFNYVVTAVNSRAIVCKGIIAVTE